MNSKIEKTAKALQKNLSSQPLHSSPLEITFKHMNQFLTNLSGSPVQTQNAQLFMSTSLELARVCFILGRGFNRLIVYLNEALHAAERIGDRRSKALINLHLSRLFYFEERRDKAMEAFSAGKSEVDSLGDEDISSQAAELIGFSYFIQGHFIEAQPYFEQAAKSFEFGEYGHSGPMYVSFCHAHLGHYNRAIGTIDYYWRMAHEKGNKPLATTLRSGLGIFLVSIKKLKEAAFHLSSALQEAIQEKNDFAAYLARGGLAFHHMAEGRLEDAKELMSSARYFSSKLGFIKLYSSPYVLEVLFEFHRNGLAPIPDFSFKNEADRILQDSNIHLRAVALRLMAVDGLLKGEEIGSIWSKLQQSENDLKLSGDPVQLGKTRIEMARLNLKQGNQDQARTLAQKAWKGFSGYGDIFYPDDLRYLLRIKDICKSDYFQQNTMLQRFTEMIGELVSSDNLSELLTQTVKATNRFLGAERGGIFWFSDLKKKKPPELIASHNLCESDISKDIFHSSLEIIFKAFHDNKPLIKNQKAIEINTGMVRTMLALPFEVEGQAKGILYHDNAYITDCFNHFSRSELTGMTNSLSKYVNQLLNLTRRLEKKASTNFKRLGEPEKKDIIAKSPVMKKKLNQVGRIAQTDSTVLVSGETGVGKELLAQRIHNLSPRNNYPLIVVDSTSIPETLVESELFGHEKGAFTGAEKQRLGRIELAHKGTLFIDEVGEIPLSIQVKLLRALQEKTVTRVGGNTTIESDFRLITATNRDLQKDVKEGRFREDLFYRLNVIPIKLPPLRERGEDIILLSEYFLKKYGIKYNHPMLKLTEDNKEMLLGYDWPGNIRELKNIIERAVLLSENDQLEFKLKTKTDTFRAESYFKDRPSLDEMQRQYINFILEENNGKIGGPDGAAHKLGMKRTSLYGRMRTLGMR